MAGRRSVAEARDTRHEILRTAADMASIDGLDGLTVGRLANELAMSKAGVIGHFGTKVELQLATLDYAGGIFLAEVWTPVEHLGPGLPRLLAVCDTWMEYESGPTFPGGCLIAAASFEFDSRPGPIHEALAAMLRRWHDRLAADARVAVDAGDLPGDTDPDQIAHMLWALAVSVSPNRGFHEGTDAAAGVRRSMRRLLGH